MTTYPNALDATHVLAYTQGIAQLAQQMQAPILNAVTRIEGKGLAMSVSDYLEPSEAQEQERRSRQNVDMQIDAKRRFAIHRKNLLSSGYIDDEDKLRASLDPTNPLMVNRVAAVRRKITERILGVKKDGSTGRYLVDGVEGTGILGIAREGAEAPTSAVSLPGGQTIVHGSTGLTLPKVTETLERLRLADHGMEGGMDELFGLISPKQVTNLINLAYASGTSDILALQQQLLNGQPTSLVGITWIMSNIVPYTAASGSSIRVCPVWSRKNIAAAFWQDIKGEMWQDTHVDNKPFQKVSANLDACRHQDDGVVVIQCAEA
jgi:hypothetical protein